MGGDRPGLPARPDRAARRRLRPWARSHRRRRRRHPPVPAAHPRPGHQPRPGGNPFHHHQDLARLRRAFGRPDTVVVHEPYGTATARHADVVLPATTTLERDDIGGASQDAALIAMHRVADPVGEARDDNTTPSAPVSAPTPAPVRWPPRAAASSWPRRPSPRTAP
ncbi:molybdopterin-dependent oxidoreductase [Streptomyces sp. OE57]|uniref:molybdopterin-dependent oxidoreductase n=1 Tax=Streptomyces lacaronensis TaxID=3379885 RepID=UPI0039B742A3